MDGGLFPVEMIFGITSISLQSMTCADTSVKSCNPGFHKGFLSCDGLDDGVRSVCTRDTLKERIWVNCVASEIVFQHFYPESDAPLDGERVVAVPEEPNLHLESYLRNVTGGM